jgi:4-amino-4-deoxy-L-arabinose transferase-like glycosyltransferase
MQHALAGPKGAVDRSVTVTSGLVVALILLPALVKLAFYPSYPGSDDAFIHIATAEHILRGDGWGIVSNDRVNLSSSPVFTVLLLPILAIASIGLAQLVTLAFACAALAVTYFATRAITASTMAALAALVIAAANAHLWRWSGTVMEASLAYLSVTIIAALTLFLIQARRASTWRLALLGALIGLGTLVRFEIGLLLPLSFVALWVSWQSDRMRLTAIVGGFTVAVLPWIVFATAYFGTPIPTTFFAKASALHIMNASVVKALGTVVASGFGVSLVLATAAFAVAFRTVEGRIKLRERAIPLLFLVSWPIALFLFYYVKTDGLQSAARYFLPGMATWPIAVGLVISAVPRVQRYRSWLAAALVICVAAGVVINVWKVQPVLAAFNGGYRMAMTHGASFLREKCKPGDVALIDTDIGIMAYDGIGDCVFVDGGALATPAVRGMTFAEKLSRVRPTYAVQSIGTSRNELGAAYPQLRLLMAESYPDHGVANAGNLDWLNIYRADR